MFALGSQKAHLNYRRLGPGPNIFYHLHKYYYGSEKKYPRRSASLVVSLVYHSFDVHFACNHTPSH